MVEKVKLNVSILTYFKEVCYRESEIFGNGYRH